MANEQERPKTEEDLFAETVEAARAAKDAPPPGRGDDPPGTQQAPASRGDDPPPQRAVEPVRDPATGQFRGSEPVQPKPPFEGYEKLDPAAKAWIDSMRGDHETLQRRHVRTQNQLRQREAALRQAEGRNPRPTQPAPAPQVRNIPAPANPAAEAKAWEAYKKQFPDDAQALEERIAASEAALGRKLTEVEQRLARIDEIEKSLQPIRETAARFQSREQEEAKAEGRGYFDQAAPNWEYLAGWKDSQGNPVPREEQAYAPDFQAWLDAIRDHSPSVADMYEAQLEHHDPRLVAKVWQDFNRDYLEATGAPHPMLQRPTQGGGEVRSRAPATDPVQQRREAARNDVQPRPAGSPGGARPAPTQQNYSPRSAEEEAYAAAVSNPEAQKFWRGLRT